jgi:hypothetical protein
MPRLLIEAERSERAILAHALDLQGEDNKQWRCDQEGWFFNAS